MNLTKAKIDGFRYEGRRIENDKGQTRWTRDVRWDHKVPGFGLRITPSNHKSFVLSYRVNGTKRLMTLGDYGTLTLDKARDKAIREKGKVLDDKDPLEVRRDAREAPTMADLERDYLERHAEKHKRPGSVREDVAMLRNYVRTASAARWFVDLSSAPVRPRSSSVLSQRSRFSS